MCLLALSRKDLAGCRSNSTPRGYRRGARQSRPGADDAEAAASAGVDQLIINAKKAFIRRDGDRRNPPDYHVLRAGPDVPVQAGRARSGRLVSLKLLTALSGARRLLSRLSHRKADGLFP